MPGRGASREGLGENSGWHRANFQAACSGPVQTISTTR